MRNLGWYIHSNIMFFSVFQNDMSLPKTIEFFFLDQLLLKGDMKENGVVNVYKYTKTKKQTHQRTAELTTQLRNLFIS